MSSFHVLAALFAVYMLVRHVPRAVRTVRAPGQRGAAVVPLANVVLAIAILAAAVKGLVGSLISR